MAGNHEDAIMDKAKAVLYALLAAAFYANAFCRYVISECKIMFYEYHCRRKFPKR